MVVSFFNLHLHLSYCRSLKDKRSEVKRLMSALRRDFNLSVAEMEYQDLWQRCRLGMAYISRDRAFAEAEAARITDAVERICDGEITESTLEILL